MDISSLSTSAVSPSKPQAKQPEASPAQNQQAASVDSPILNTRSETVQVLERQAAQLNQQLDNLGQSLSFTVDESTQSSVVKIIDKTTDEVIKQFPSEGSLRIMKNIQNYLNTVQQSGLPGQQGLTGALFNEII